MSPIVKSWVISKDEHEAEDGKDCSRCPRKISAAKPHLAGRDLCLRIGFFGCGRGERDYRAALRADGEMSHCGFALVSRQSMLDEGAQLICIRMPAGLKHFTHR